MKPDHTYVGFDPYREKHVFEFPLTSYRVIDGDTVEILVDLGFNISHKVAIRLRGVNTPEKRGVQAEAGKKVTTVVENWFIDNVERGIKCLVYSLDKFNGRALGDFYYEDSDHHLSSYLLENGLGVEYDGNIKDDFDEESLKVIIKKAEATMRQGG